MKKPPDTPEFAKFTDALKSILKVPKAEMLKRIEAEKTPKKPR